LFALNGRPALAQADNSKKVPITTSDGVELQATLWPNPSGKKDAVVMLLHNFDRAKGGGSHQDGWDYLAAMLQQDGFTVISFDFRGFGESKTVSKSFWKWDYNQRGMRRRGAAAETIDQKDFYPGYYINLVNDIAAVKAYLDRQNDLKNLNSSNLILVGAGEGATLGALWASLQFKQFRLAGGGGGFGAPAAPEDPEGKDLVCAAWLTISTRLVTIPMVGLSAWLRDVGLKHKVPMLFMYGKDDKANETVAFNFLKFIVPNFKLNQKPTDKAFEYTRNWEVKDTKLTGSKLLNQSLDTAATIKYYLNDNMQKRGSRESRNRDYIKSSYYWLLPNKQTIPAKYPGEELPRPIPLQQLGIR
jgi:hypothetical protein